MSRPCFEQPEQKRLLVPCLNKRSLDTSPPELRQSLAYVLHLRSLWKPKGRTKLVVPASWMEFLVLGAGKGKPECTTRASSATDRACPFRDVRFESNDAGTRLLAPEEILPRDVVLQVLTDSGTADDRLATFVSRAFEGIPRTRLSRRYAHTSDESTTYNVAKDRRASDVPAATSPSHHCLPGALGHILDFALVAGDDGSNDAKNVFSGPGSNLPCLLLGTKEPTGMPHPHSATSFDDSKGCQFHLARLALRVKREAVRTHAKPESFPEWLVLFGLLYDTHHVLVVAYVPLRRLECESDVIDCAAYIVDQLSLPPLVTVDGPRACELTFARLRFLAALATLRRHVYELSKLLFAAIAPSDGIRRTECGSPCDQQGSDDSEYLIKCTSLVSSSHCSSVYSTCPPSIHSREVIDAPDPPDHECREELSSSYRSFTSSYCSTCPSSLESASTSEYSRSGSSRCTDFSCMEPSMTSRPQGDEERFRCLDKLAEAKRRDIIAWTRQVVATEHPVKDTYRMVIYHPHPRRRRAGDSKSSRSR